MVNTVYLDTVAQTARAAMSGTALPSITGKLLSYLPITGIFFSGDDVVTIDADTGKCIIKPKEAPAGAPALIDVAAELVTVGADTHYLFKWASADSVELRAYLDTQADPSQPTEMRCEIEYAIDGETARIAFPILMQTSYTRPEDPAPSATSDTSWLWIKQVLAAGSNVTLLVDDTAKTITIIATGGGGGGSSAWADITGKPTTLAGYGITDALTADLAASTYQTIITNGSLTIARTNGLQAALDAKLSSVAAAAAYQPLSSALTIYAGISPSVNVRAILSAADYAAVRTLLGLLIGSNVQAYSANLDTLAAGLGASIGQRLVAWDGSTYALLSGALSAAYGGTGISSYTVGDMLYIAGGGNMAKLAGNTTTTKKFLTQTGDGTTAGAPAYGQIQAADVPTLNQNTTGTAAAASGLKTLSNTVVVSAAAAPSAGMQLVATSATTAEWQYPKVELVISASNTTDNLTTGTLKETFRMPHAMTLTSVRISCSTAPTGSVIIVDVKEAGTSIFSTKPQIADGAKTSVGGAVPGVLSDTSLADDAEITINLDQIGSSVAGKGLKVTLIGTRS